MKYLKRFLESVEEKWQAFATTSEFVRLMGSDSRVPMSNRDKSNVVRVLENAGFTRNTDRVDPLFDLDLSYERENVCVYVGKLEDDWFLVAVLIEHPNTYFERTGNRVSMNVSVDKSKSYWDKIKKGYLGKYYKVDQIDGLDELLEFILN